MAGETVVTPRAALGGVAGIYAALAVLLIVARPPWEAPDEFDHVRNVETLTRGKWYEIDRSQGVESHQPPLYYLLEAGWQATWGVGAREPEAHSSPDCAKHAFAGDAPRCALWRHDLPSDGADTRLLALLRLPGAAFGLGAVLLTAAAARRLTKDPWTPVVAAAVVATCPAFVIATTSVNNDALAYLLGGVAALLGVVAARGDPDGWRLPITVGVTAGAFVLTKLTLLLLVPGLLLALALAARSTRIAARLAVIACGAALRVSAPWLIRNVDLYGDPLAAAETRDYLERQIPLAFSGESWSRRAFVTHPRTVWKELWYRSQHFTWHWWSYIPIW